MNTRITVILYPCPCCPTWNVNEWEYLGDTITKHNHVREFHTIDAAREHYRPILGELIESIYDPRTDTYTDKHNPHVNFVVQGSHGRCHNCRSKEE